MDNMTAVQEVILRDFDGSETVYPAGLPLSAVIRTGDDAEGVLVTRRYIKSEETDTLGRVVYVQTNLG